jgi:hypothetical protein
VCASRAWTFRRQSLGCSPLQLLQLIKNGSHAVVPSRRLDVCTDSVDNIFIECADKAGSDYLVTELLVTDCLHRVDGGSTQGGEDAGRSGAEEKDRGYSGEEEGARVAVWGPVSEQLVEGKEDQESA